MKSKQSEWMDGMELNLLKGLFVLFPVPQVVLRLFWHGWNWVERKREEKGSKNKKKSMCN